MPPPVSAPNPDLAAYRSLLDPSSFDQLQQAIARPLVPSLRVNTLLTTIAQAQAEWPGWYGWEIEPVPFCPAGWRITGSGEGESGTGVAPARTPEHRLGRYYIQDAASMLPAELLALEPGQLVLDMAAAPGGKTTHLIDRLGDRGLVVANDSSRKRLGALRAVLQNWGAANICVTNYLGEFWGAWFPETFDRVLLDAPCSGQGLRQAERRASRPVSDTERKSLQAQQIRLLVSGFQALKPGGEMVYATCTLHPDENEAVLDALLARYPAAAEIASAQHLIHSPPAPALATDGLRHYHPTVQQAVRLWPHLYDTGGFFAALVRKREPLPSSDRPALRTRPRRTLRERGFKACREPALARYLDRQFGFDLDAALADLRLSLWQRGDQIRAIPELYLERLADLPASSIGMLLAVCRGSDLIPSHELVSRFGASFTRGRLTIPASDVGRWLQGQEMRFATVPGDTQGVVLIQDPLGRFLGRGKLIRTRLRNLLPRRLLY